MNPGGGSGWDEPPLDIQIPDDARELDRDVLAYQRELRATRRRNRLRRLAGPLAGHGTLMPLLASILAVCLVAGAMLSVATFSPPAAPARPHKTPTVAASSSRLAVSRDGPASSAATAPALAPHPARATRSASSSPAATRPRPSARVPGASSP